ncbi:MAG: Threonine--tRNA ligase 2 [Chlamydiia bacterium]|nr:Threonine--tRNA ligase 2 [Chlamydiia bacterium]
MSISCNEKEISIESKTTGLELLKDLGITAPDQGVAISINGVMKDFSDEIQPGDEVKIYSFADKEGKEVFWHTSAHILAQAVLRLFPDAEPTIGPVIEGGFYYDFANLKVTAEDFKAIEKEVKKILKENFATEKVTFNSKQEALDTFKDNLFKKEIITLLPDDGVFTAYRQGEFFDLCRGPHLPKVGKVKAFKILKSSAAYWRGDQERESLTRIYGISFPDKDQLKAHLHFLEEAKKRDHRVIGQKLGLFSFTEYAPGMPIIEPNGMVIWNELLKFWRQLHTEDDYVEIKTPAMMDKSLWELSGHFANYKENMYLSEIDKGTYAIKPMNCPACMLYFKSKRHSYRDLPHRVGEIGNVHRHELSGSLSGLLRVRSFHQDDAHIFMRKDQIKDEILGVLKLTDKLYSSFGLSYHLELSTRPETKTIGTDEDWDISTKALQDALETWGKGYVVNEGDGAFYGPKIDIHVSDALGRTWQCGTIQLDMSLPERFELKYTDENGEDVRPIMIHRALYGSIERFFAILIEHYKGRFPLWLSPKQISLLPVADRHIEECQKISTALKKQGFRVSIDTSNESISKKVRTAQMQQVNKMIIIGDKEVETSTLSCRDRDTNETQDSINLNDFIDALEVLRNSKA